MRPALRPFDSAQGRPEQRRGTARWRSLPSTQLREPRAGSRGSALGHATPGLEGPPSDRLCQGGYELGGRCTSRGLLFGRTPRTTALFGVTLDNRSPWCNSLGRAAQRGGHGGRTSCGSPEDESGALVAEHLERAHALDSNADACVGYFDLLDRWGRHFVCHDRVPVGECVRDKIVVGHL